MYELLLFTGGIYKFNEFKEFIDDLGGLIIEMESFKVSRGMYFLSEEVKVLILVPIGEKKK
ncbi:methyl-coenzyme M reductase family protein [Methanobrevibacter arboriphilus]|uniref:methyl-coenzyme M reductase family protein n=1 Tax=Methanobrevibacter arboriphilus TaxID=39441 RepID=UPI0005B28843|nr:methyl-coenzyme M reductase family protein [Methanobrevibacter arboriphilus]